MANSRTESSTRRRILAASMLATSALVPLGGARAALILDDFDDAFEIIMPEMDGQYVVQSGIGPLGVERWSQVNATSASQPIGRADANTSGNSALTVEIERLNPHPEGGPPTLGVNLLYFFDELDVTQGGSNDRVVVEFDHLRSVIPMAMVSVFLQDASQRGVSYGHQLFDISQQDQPFSLEFPLDSFGVRGGGSGRIDYQRVYRISVHIVPTHFDVIDEIDFSTAVARIRFANAVPEPGTSVLACLGFVLMAISLARKGRCGHEYQMDDVSSDRNAK